LSFGVTIYAAELTCRTIERLQNGKIRMTADACPAFLWKGDPPGIDCDPNNMMDGFLEGFTLERVGIWL
jgi:uncharacterized protein YehS (DUF1456 family)